MLSKPEIDRRITQFKSAAIQAGVKLTYQRLEIFKEIASSIDHPDVETLFQKLKAHLPTLSIDTVYRTLWLLTDLGMITTLGLRRESTRFDANLEHHHHFVCTRCGLVRDFSSQELNDLHIPVAVKTYGRIVSTHVEVRGICATCSKDPVVKTTPRNPQAPKGKKGRHS